MITVGVLICLITLTSQLVHSKVITINITSGNSSPQCCTEERCMCASLTVALQYINSSTTINITSSSVMLEESVKLGSGHTSGSGNITDITITGSNVTIMCNNSGSVYCESCSNVKIEGITWDRCGNASGTNIAGVTFTEASNISLVNCTFQHSQAAAVTLLNVYGKININDCDFLSNKGILMPVAEDCGILNVHSSGSTLANLNISYGYFYDSNFSCGTYIGYAVNLLGDAIEHVSITNTTFLSNSIGAMALDIGNNSSIELTELTFKNNTVNMLAETTSSYHAILCCKLGGISRLLVFNSLFSDNIGYPLFLTTEGSEIVIRNSTFTNNHEALISLMSSSDSSSITFEDVDISHNISPNDSSLSLQGILFVSINTTMIIFTRVNVTSNNYRVDTGGVVYIQCSTITKKISFKECEFFNNTSIQDGAAFYIDNDNRDTTECDIINSRIHHNMAGNSVIYLNNMITMTVISSKFTNNLGSCVYLLHSYFISQSAIFANNTADTGAALCLVQRSSFSTHREETVQFINNSATEHGGAIYIDLPYDCFSPFTVIDNYFQASFVNNTAVLSGNSLYFDVNKYCKVNTNISDSSSFLYAPCHFNYSQPVNGKMMHIPCDLDYTLLNGTGAPIVTTPHELKLYFPFDDGYNISNTTDHNIYFIGNNVLRYPVKFTGAVFDYFGNPAEPIKFYAQCVNCSSSKTLLKLSKTLLLLENIASLSITFKGENIENKINVTIRLTSVMRSIKQIITTLVVELLPCIDHPGYTYSIVHEGCACYHHNVDCHDSYNEIKRGYWFGSVSNTATTAPCHHYCKFTGYTETRQGYFELPNTIDGQCNDHRVGRACGECSSGYTLSYDSTDCISVDQCGAGWTVLVITLTCLYWIAIVAGVFGLMYFKFQISLGYLYGLIYYYSIMNILLDSNPNLSDGVFQFALVLSSFAQLTPQFLGKLCFVKGLSGIDQLFIHYSHAVGVSLLLLLIVVAARCSARVSLFVSRCIIRVICLLILLSYTSIVSTSLQLLQPLRFTDVKEWYTYSSPNIQYFHGRHAVYGVVAITCELFVGIGLPLLLLLQPFLSRKINFIRIKPLLDQFQGCYKDKYRWFAAYYLICRQVIIMIAYSFNNDYYNMIFYLQGTCVVIAGIHVWIQPYKSALLNGLDGVMLLLMILANSFVFVDNLIFLILLSFPLLLLGAAIVQQGISFCKKKGYHFHYYGIKSADDRVGTKESIIAR